MWVPRRKADVIDLDSRRKFLQPDEDVHIPFVWRDGCVGALRSGQVLVTIEDSTNSGLSMTPVDAVKLAKALLVAAKCSQKKRSSAHPRGLNSGS